MPLIYFSIRITPQLQRIIRREAKQLKIGMSKRIRDVLESRYAYELAIKK